jgi:hypothetical protein
VFILSFEVKTLVLYQKSIDTLRTGEQAHNLTCKSKIITDNSMALVHEQTTPTERPLLVGEVVSQRYHFLLQ